MVPVNKQELIQFEEGVKELYSSGKIHAPVHLVGNNEEQLIEIFREVRSEDWVFSTYRSHYHALLKGVPPGKVKAEILAGRSMHLNFKEYNFFTSSVAGGCLPIALGVAMAIKMRSEERKVWCFVGDMASEMGIFHECTKYAMNHNLPIAFCVEDNGLSVETPTAEVWGIRANPAPRFSFDDQRIEVLLGWDKGKVIRYRYTRTYPHQGVGRWVAF